MRALARRAAGTVALAGEVVLFRPGIPANWLVRCQLGAAGRRLCNLGGRLQGASYRLRDRHPDPDVMDTVLADRIRSSLGDLEIRLDLPHVHVMIEDRVALVRGEVGSEDDAAEIARAVAAVSGVVGVESCLHVGLSRGAGQ